MASKKIQERNQKTIKDLQKIAHNKFCADCGEKLPQYVNLTHATFVCMVCSGIHREFSHRIKGISLSEFTAEEAEIMKQGGNDLDRITFMARYNSSDVQIPHPGDTQQIRVFIRAKYVEKRWIAGSSTRSNDRSHSKPREGSVEKPKKDHTSHEKSKGNSSSVARDKSVPHPREKHEKTQPSSTNDLIDIFSTPQPETNFGSMQPIGFQNHIQTFTPQQQQLQGSDWANFATPQAKVTGFETQNLNNFSNPFGGFDDVNKQNVFQASFPNTINTVPNSGFNDFGMTNRGSITSDIFDQFAGQTGFPMGLEQSNNFPNTQLQPNGFSNPQLQSNAFPNTQLQPNGFPNPQLQSNTFPNTQLQPNTFSNPQFQAIPDKNPKMQAFEELLENERQETLRQQQKQNILYGGDNYQQQQQVPNNFVGSQPTNPFGVTSFPDSNIGSNSVNWSHSMPGHQQFPGTVSSVQQQFYSQPAPQSQFYPTSTTSPFDELLQSHSQPTGNVNNQKQQQQQQQQQKPQLFTEFAINQFPRNSVIAPTASTRPIENFPSNLVQPPKQQQSSGNPFDDLF